MAAHIVWFGIGIALAISGLLALFTLVLTGEAFSRPAWHTVFAFGALIIGGTTAVISGAYWMIEVLTR